MVFNYSQKLAYKDFAMVSLTTKARDDEIQDKRERRDREIPYLLDFSPLLGDSPDTTSNISSDDLNSDDFNSDDDIPTLEARITVSPTPDPTPDPTPAPTPTPASIPSFAPALLTKPLLKSILKRKRQVEVTISSDDDDNRSDLDDREKELLRDSNYRPGNSNYVFGHN
ncbi:hypothetical protein BGZ57DRAFT_851386 [Hyaloscypha finlandica]|nr:hypothetical protein BGZ57DRAFT_851386 [Hyaloscypha finlandica]